MNDKEPPLFSVKSGRIEVAVWENQNKNGQKYPTFKLQKNYQDQKDNGIWKSTHSLNLDDLPLASQVLLEARLRWVLKELGVYVPKLEHNLEDKKEKEN